MFNWSERFKKLWKNIYGIVFYVYIEVLGLEKSREESNLINKIVPRDFKVINQIFFVLNFMNYRDFRKQKFVM